VGDAKSGEVLVNEHRELTTRPGLRALLKDLSAEIAD
jgi:hypothetical protein